MAIKLTDNLNSLYIQAANSLRAKAARKTIVAYVESYDDVAFWNHILSRFENDEYRFRVALPSSNTLAKGKKAAMMNELGASLGQNMIACVDADYDYLMQGATSTSRQLINCPYVLHTYAYAIENFQCNPATLEEVCVQATLNDKQFIDFPAFFRLYSNIIHPLFVWNIWSYRKNHLSTFSIQDFATATRLGPVSISTPATSLEQVSIKVKKKIEWLRRHFPDKDEEIKELSKELETLGVTPDNTWMFIQGHHLKEQVALKLLIPICARLRREREAEIKALALHEQQLKNELTSYRHSEESVENILKKNIRSEELSISSRIEDDIRQLLELCHQADAPGTPCASCTPTKEEPQQSQDIS